jgi:plasmid replication initiation protein
MTELNYRNKLIVKSNSLIESKYHLSVREQKFLIYLASLVKKDDKNFEYTSVRIKDIESALKAGGDSKWGSIYEVVREIVLNINKKPISIRKEDGGWVIINWFASVEASPSEGIVTFELSNIIKSKLVMLNEYFTKYKFGNILALRSGYSIRIYELLKLNQYKHQITYDLDFFRELIGVSYQDENRKMLHKYPEYKAFKRSIINHAKEELKRETDIYFEIKETRANRKVKSLTFYVFKNDVEKIKTQHELFVDNQPEEEVEDKFEYDNDIIHDFLKIGLTMPKAKKLYSEGFNNIEDVEIRKHIVNNSRLLDEYLKEKIDYVNGQLKKGKVLNPPGLLIKAIKENYGSKEAERKRKIKGQRKIQREKEALKAIQGKELDAKQSKIIKREMAIIHELINGKELFLEKLLANESYKLWKGYDSNFSIKENFNNSNPALPFKYKVIAKIKKTYPKKFELLEKDRLVANQMKKKIELL